jgi:hypothetical protein
LRVCGIGEVRTATFSWLIVLDGRLWDDRPLDVLGLGLVVGFFDVVRNAGLEKPFAEVIGEGGIRAVLRFTASDKEFDFDAKPKLISNLLGHGCGSEVLNGGREAAITMLSGS